MFKQIVSVLLGVIIGYSGLVGMIGFIWFSLSRQRKATEELQKKLVERRKARRERAATGAAS